MQRAPDNYYYKAMADPAFPVDVINREISEPGTMISHHWHEHIQFLSLFQGQVAVTFGTETVEARAGDLVIINPFELHAIECREAPLRCRIIRVDFSFLSGHISDSAQALYMGPLEKGQIIFSHLVRGDEAASSCVETIAREYEKRERGFELAIKGELYRLVTILFRSYCVRHLKSREKEMQDRTMERLSAVLEFMDSHLSDALRLEELSAIVGVSVYHFCRSFRSATGLSPMEYLNRERIRLAERMLRETGATISEIASNCGVPDANYFSRMFRKYQGKSPREYRRALADCRRDAGLAAEH